MVDRLLFHQHHKEEYIYRGLTIIKDIESPLSFTGKSFNHLFAADVRVID